jgi:hypothetical protein
MRVLDADDASKGSEDEEHAAVYHHKRLGNAVSSRRKDRRDAWSRQRID